MNIDINDKQSLWNFFNEVESLTNAKLQQAKRMMRRGVLIRAKRAYIQEVATFALAYANTSIRLAKDFPGFCTSLHRIAGQFTQANDVWLQTKTVLQNNQNEQVQTDHLDEAINRCQSILTFVWQELGVLHNQLKLTRKGVG